MSKLVLIALPNGHLVVRVPNGPRIGTLFNTGQGWCYQFDGAAQEGPVCHDAAQALEAMEALATPDPQGEHPQIGRTSTVTRS